MRFAVRGTPRTTYGSISVTLAAVYAPHRLLSFGPMITKRAAKPAQPGDPASTVRPRRKAAAKTATVPPATEAPIDGVQLDAAILRFLRRNPNQTVDLTPLAAELGLDPYRLQLAVEDLGRRRMVVVPFIEPGTAGGATLTQVGLQWLHRSRGRQARRQAGGAGARQGARPGG